MQPRPQPPRPVWHFQPSLRPSLAASGQLSSPAPLRARAANTKHRVGLVNSKLGIQAAGKKKVTRYFAAMPSDVQSFTFSELREWAPLATAGIDALQAKACGEDDCSIMLRLDADIIDEVNRNWAPLVATATALCATAIQSCCWPQKPAAAVVFEMIRARWSKCLRRCRS